MPNYTCKTIADNYCQKILENVAGTCEEFTRCKISQSADTTLLKFLDSMYTRCKTKIEKRPLPWDPRKN